MPKTSTIIISGDGATIPKVLKLLERFDITNASKDDKLNPDINTVEDTSFLIYKVQYHYGEAILQAIQGIGEDLKSSTAPSTVALVNAIRSLSFVQVTNSLLSTGDAKALTRLKELIQTIDVPLKQVFIEVLVIETDLESSLEFGLRWATQGNYKGRLQFGAANNNAADTANQTGINFPANVNAVVPPTTAPVVADIPVTPGGYLGVIGDLIFHKGKSYITLGDFVNALQSDVNATVVLNQKIITQDNRQSSLFVGSNVPYNGSVVTNQGQNTTVTTSNIQYLDIGIKLDITPKVGEDNVVTLDISQDISEQTSSNGSSGSSNTQVNGITTKRTSLDTSVHVPNQHFVVLTGQIRNTQARSKYMIPCLGGLPLIGAAFSDSITNKQSVTVVMFIKPHIVNTYEEYKKITQKQEDVYRDIGVAEDFDEGVELVRDPDDY
jgi:type III secretion protein C